MNIVLIVIILAVYSPTFGQSVSPVSHEQTIQEMISQTEKQQNPIQFQSILDSLSYNIDIHDFVLNRLGNSFRTSQNQKIFNPYIDYVCFNMDDKFRESLKFKIKKLEIAPRDLSRVYNCVFKNEKQSCEFIYSIKFPENDTLRNSHFESFSNFFESNKARCDYNQKHLNTDSFEIQKYFVELRYELEYHEFDSLLNDLSKYGGIHYYVLERIEQNRRTEGMHEYYPAFFSYVCNNMDSIFRNEIIAMIEADSIERYMAYPIVKSHLFDSKKETCEFLNSLELEEKYNKTESFLYESLIKLKEELNCSM